MVTLPYEPFIRHPLKKYINVTELITILCYDLAPNFRTEGERHDFWEMVCVDRGELRYRSEDAVRVLRSGEIVFHKPNEFHNIECDGVHSASVFIITFQCSSPAMKFFCGRSIKATGNILALVKRLSSECANNFCVSEYPLKALENSPYGGQQLIKIYLEELLIQIIRNEDKKNSKAASHRITSNEGLAEKISEYLSKNIYEKVTLDGICEEFHYGKSRLCELFKRVYGKTIIQYYTTLKVMEAKRLLFENSLTVSEISELLGFESPEYFSRVFRRYAGMSPQSFRGTIINGSVLYLEKEKPLNK